MKGTLEKYDTALLMCTKNHKIKLKYKYDENFVFEKNNEILNSYKEIAIVYADSRAIPLECVQVDYIVKAMLEIFEIIYPNKFKELICDIMKYQNEQTNKILFINLYGYLQSATLLSKDGEELFNLDYELIDNM